MTHYLWSFDLQWSTIRVLYNRVVVSAIRWTWRGYFRIPYNHFYKGEVTLPGLWGCSDIPGCGGCVLEKSVWETALGPGRNPPKPWGTIRAAAREGGTENPLWNEGTLCVFWNSPGFVVCTLPTNPPIPVRGVCLGGSLGPTVVVAMVDWMLASGSKWKPDCRNNIFKDVCWFVFVLTAELELSRIESLLSKDCK